MDIRIGLGYDVHRFAAGRKLFLCGIEIDHPLGLLGHSDADVAIHAVCDALLGAVNAGDIGQWFPDNDPTYQNADSKLLLQKIMQSDELASWQVGNLDMVIITQSPKILPLVPIMRSKMAELLNCPGDRISIKGKTTEGLGFAGRSEGIAVQAVVLMQKRNCLND